MQQTDMVLLSQKPDSFGLAWSLNDYCVAMPFNAMGNIGKISGQERGGGNYSPGRNKGKAESV